MAEIKEIVEDENKISTVIAEDIQFRGKIIFKDSLKIKGLFEGKIETEGHIIIDREAKISADINAGIITNNGNANGKFKAIKKIELNTKSNTSGDIISPDLAIEKGAIFNGTCIMNE